MFAEGKYYTLKIKKDNEQISIAIYSSLTGDINSNPLLQHQNRSILLWLHSGQLPMLPDSKPIYMRYL